MNKPRLIKEWDETEAHRDQWLPLLLDFQDGTLGASERANLEKHLKECGICQSDLDGMRQTVTLLHRLPEQTVPRSFAISPLQARRLKPSPIYRFSEFAAAIAAALLIFAFAFDLAGTFTPAPPVKQAVVTTADPTATLEPVGTLAISGDNNTTGAVQALGNVPVTPQTAQATATPTSATATALAATQSSGPDLRVIEIALVIATVLFTVFAVVSRPRAPGRLKI
ncbi:MAG: zf-HC2 domain-containing protein [Chloroflexi bacterium]|nr:zf-HC2 domain-containing protein [Chloroflexota bacterium]OJW05367.1 MAG: hypothetical protein BGO39_33750 [Chloroflexi bacterium 54-19]